MSAAKSDTAQLSAPHGRVTFLDGRGDLPMIEITTPWSTAAIYFHGAHVTHFQKKDEPPLLFLSQCSNFADGQPIRGGIPIIFPWFGKPADKPGQHGFVRIKDWELREFGSPADGSVTVRFRLADCNDELGCAPCTAEYAVTVSDSLRAELMVTNKSADEFEFENCLHTYFSVGDIKAVKVVGLKGRDYLDQLSAFARVRAGDGIRRRHHIPVQARCFHAISNHVTDHAQRGLQGHRGRRKRLIKRAMLQFHNTNLRHTGSRTALSHASAHFGRKRDMSRNEDPDESGGQHGLHDFILRESE